MLPDERESGRDPKIFTITIALEQIVRANEFDRARHEQEFAEKFAM